MTQLDITLREGLPPELQTLYRDLPRDRWPDHPNLANSTRNWMGAHAGFRQLGAWLQSDAERYLGGDLDDQAYADLLGPVGDSLVRNLHGHHSWEDRHFFPELAAADPRFEAGLEMLETDHVALDALLDDLTQTGNRVLRLATLEPAQMPDNAARLRDLSERLNGFLERHLTDEEDLVVPIILHHRLRG